MTGPELRAIRHRLGLSQPELAARLGVTKLTVLRWETEQWPISPMLELALEALLARAPEPPKGNE